MKDLLHKRVVLIVLTLAALFSSTSVVGAVEPVTTPAPAPTATQAPAPTAGADGIVPFESMMYNIISNGSQKVAIVGGFLSESTALPAKVEVAVPKGAAVFWVGEVAGSTSQDQDITLTQQKRTEGEFDVYSATLTRFRAIQVEYNVTDPFKTNANGVMGAELSYTPFRDIGELALAAEIPADSVVANPDFTLQGQGGGGGNIYARPMGPIKAGQLASTDITYTAATAATNGQASTGPTSSVTVVLIVVIVALVAVLAFVLLSRKMK